MQKNKALIRDIGIVLLNIFMVVSLVLVLMLKNDYGYRLYWVITSFLLILVIKKLSARGLNVDTEKSKVIQRSFADTATLSTVFFGIIYLFIQGVEYFRKDIIDNPYIIVGFFIVMIIYEAFTYLSIYVAKRDTARLLEKKYNHKRK